MKGGKKQRDQVRPHGQIRQSQMVTTFGPGAMIDLPQHAVIVSGLDFWNGYRAHSIPEDRLAAKVEKLLGRPYEFYAPPPDANRSDTPTTGVTVWLFPEWFVVQEERRDPSGVRSRALVHRQDLEPNLTYRPSHRDKAKRVVPVRFVQACQRGHVSDIDWRAFVHGTSTCRQ